VLRPSATDYDDLLHHLDLSPHIRNEDELLAEFYSTRWIQLDHTWNTLETTLQYHPTLPGQHSTRVMSYDLGRPWTRTDWDQTERWRQEFEEMKEARWYGNGHGGGDQRRRWLWENVIGPEVRAWDACA
jgi:hypothetical protein